MFKIDLAERMVRSYGTRVSVAHWWHGELSICGGGLLSGSYGAKRSESVNDKMFWLRGECGPFVALCEAHLWRLHDARQTCGKELGKREW